MAERIGKKESIRRPAGRMHTDGDTAAQWLNGVSGITRVILRA